MNTDCYFEIGHSHTICEDYALTGDINENISYAIICDGCSSSKSVDVGARIIAHSAKDYLYNRCNFLNEIPDDIDAYEVGLSIIRMASFCIKAIGLPYSALDTTLIITLASKKKNLTFFYGDGGLLFKVDDAIYYEQVEFPSGAPFYLSYLLEPSREKAYKNQFGQKAVTKYYEVKKDSLKKVYQRISKNFDTPDFYRNISGGGANSEWVAIMSDGIQTYETIDNNGDRKSSPLIDILKKISDYKGFKGQFVERRMRRMKKDCEKNGIIHFDDVSIASIYIWENKWRNCRNIH